MKNYDLFIERKPVRRTAILTLLPQQVLPNITARGAGCYTPFSISDPQNSCLIHEADSTS